MNKSWISATIKFIIVVLVIAIFYILINNNLIDIVIKDDFIDYRNDFKYKPSNTRILYKNAGDLPWNRHAINSSIPFDVKVKSEVGNAYYYEYDNKTYEEKLKEIFRSNCEELIIATEGTNWGLWENPKAINDKTISNKILDYYDKIFNFIYNKLNNSPEMQLNGIGNDKVIQIVHDILLRYRQNKDDDSYYMFDIEMIFYREGKLQGKHVKIVAVTNGVIVNVILTKIIGVVSEDNIIIYPYTGIDNLNNVDFDTFIPLTIASVDSATKNSKDNTFAVKDEYLYSEIETVMYKKLLEEENIEDTDISNNNYHPKKEELINRANECVI